MKILKIPYPMNIILLLRYIFIYNASWTWFLFLFLSSYSRLFNFLCYLASHVSFKLTFHSFIFFILKIDFSFYGCNAYSSKIVIKVHMKEYIKKKTIKIIFELLFT
jgi:hypothetical protein